MIALPGDLADACSAPRWLLLFANSFRRRGDRLRASPARTLNIVTILLYAQIRGDVLHNQNLGYALALGMIVITGASPTSLYILDCAPAAERWLRVKTRAASPSLARRSSFGVPSTSWCRCVATLRVLAARCDAAQYSFDAYRNVLGDPNFRGLVRLFRRHGRCSPPSLVGVGLVVPTAYFIQPAGCRSWRPLVEFHHPAAVGRAGDRHRLRLPAHLQFLVAGCR